LHWDGDTILFITDNNGNVIDFKAGLDGDVTPMDSQWIGLTVYDRDAAGVVISSTNNGRSFVDPLDAQDGSSLGSGDASTMMPMYAPYVRPDGFLALNIQINGVRAFDPAQQGWTTPDAYEGDVHDPASQMKYMWNRGNPVDYADPSGYDAASMALERAASVSLKGAAEAAAHIVGAPVAVLIDVLTPTGLADDTITGYNRDHPNAGINHKSGEHTKGARPSTEGKHQEGEARKGQDYGGEKGDANRQPPRRPPPGHKGPWPPKSNTPRNGASTSSERSS